MNILLIEDKIDHQRIMRAQLEQNIDDIKVFPSSTTNEAETILSKFHIDLIILDYALPDKTGLDWYHDYIKTEKDPNIRMVPILFVTVFGMVEEIKRLANTKENIIMIEKPFRMNDLIAATKKLLSI